MDEDLPALLNLVYHLQLSARSMQHALPPIAYSMQSHRADCVVTMVEDMSRRSMIAGLSACNMFPS